MTLKSTTVVSANLSSDNLVAKLYPHYTFRKTTKTTMTMATIHFLFIQCQNNSPEASYMEEQQNTYKQNTQQMQFIITR
jgi:hypothetical protein